MELANILKLINTQLELQYQLLAVLTQRITKLETDNEQRPKQVGV